MSMAREEGVDAPRRTSLIDEALSVESQKLNELGEILTVLNQDLAPVLGDTVPEIKGQTGEDKAAGSSPLHTEMLDHIDRIDTLIERVAFLRRRLTI